MFVFIDQKSFTFPINDCMHKIFYVIINIWNVNSFEIKNYRLINTYIMLFKPVVINNTWYEYSDDILG